MAPGLGACSLTLRRGAPRPGEVLVSRCRCLTSGDKAKGMTVYFTCLVDYSAKFCISSVGNTSVSTVSSGNYYWTFSELDLQEGGTYSVCWKDASDNIVSNEYNKNENIIITLLIGMIILNWSYPLILFFTWEWDPEFGGGIVLGMIGFKTLLIGAGGIPQLFQNKKDVKKDIRSIFYVRNRPKTDFESKSKSSLTKFSNDKKHKHNDLNNNQQFDNTHNLTIPKINGEYTEEFMRNYGTLRIGSFHAFIEFYFPGPDARYKGTFISINENDIDKYINAYKNNWQTAEKLQVKIFDTPDAKFNQLGEMGMNITVSHNSITLCIDSYHLPICSRKECDDIINHLNIAKHRIKEIRQRLFYI